jgi:hypothetical protein
MIRPWSEHTRVGATHAPEQRWKEGRLSVELLVDNRSGKARLIFSGSQDDADDSCELGLAGFTRGVKSLERFQPRTAILDLSRLESLSDIGQSVTEACVDHLNSMGCQVTIIPSLSSRLTVRSANCY